MSASQPSYPPPGYYQVPPPLRAPEGTQPGTVWIWLLVVLPVVEMLASIPLLLGIGDLYAKIFGSINLSGPPPSNAVIQDMLSGYAGIVGPVLWVTLAGYLLMGVGVLLGWLDWRELRRRGVPKPFHWAWGFFAFAGAGTLVYLIGRSVVVRRRTDRGLAPLWTGIVVTIAIMIASIAWGFYLFSTALGAINLR
ncbi:MAG TPA: hypothetical protein VNQ52_01310 [Microbacteriaceae bacterium]|nr:hypothetical protein [Microbacteriaceae bacterium]